MSAQNPEPVARMVVGIDGSPQSRRALGWAVEEAARTGKAVHAVMTWNPEPLFATPPPSYVSFDEIRADHQSMLDRTVEDVLGGRTDVPVTRELCEGDAARRLVERSTEAAMLVLGSHGRSRLGNALLGSVGSACIRRAYCPVLIIPPHLAAGATAEQQDAEEEAAAPAPEQAAQQSAVPQQIAGPWF